MCHATLLAVLYAYDPPGAGLRAPKASTRAASRYAIFLATTSRERPQDAMCPSGAGIGPSKSALWQAERRLSNGLNLAVYSVIVVPYFEAVMNVVKRLRRNFRFLALLLCTAVSLLLQPPARAQNVRVFEDNADSIAVVIGNRNYRSTVSVDFAHNDADAMRAFLSRSFGFRDANIFVLKDATLGEFYQMFGTGSGPQSGKLWRDVKEGRSNVFVYFSGHGVPDLASGQPFLLPFDGDPNQAVTGYPLDTLYRNLELVKRKVGQNRHVFVMIDACFTGETGRRGESLLAVSAPGFVPARPTTGSGVIKLVATSGASPANWDDEAKLGLFTSRALLAATDLAQASDTKADPSKPNPPKPDLSWAAFRHFVIDSVAEAARRTSGREQVPEIDDAAITLKADKPLPALARAYDEAAWRAAEAAGTVAAYENYAAHCGPPCTFKDRALDALDAMRDAAGAAADNANWQRLSAQGKYQEYLDGCTIGCAYRDIARRYLAGSAPQNPPRVAVVSPPVTPAVPAADPCRGPVTASLPTQCAVPLTAAQERGLTQGDTFRECENCPEMVVMPTGSFTMGAPPPSPESERPLHTVTIGQPFAVGKFHVTVDQFGAFVRDTGYTATTNCYKYSSRKTSGMPGVGGGSWRDPGFAQAGSHPVVCVSWDDARAYVAWLAKKTGGPYRLLSDAEFEYATRGRTSPGSYSRFWFGDNEKDLCRYANILDRNARNTIARERGNSYAAACNDGHAYTSPVGSYPPNAFGLYDMAGNANEWTQDCWHPTFNGAPSDGSAWTTACDENPRAHVVRGGSWTTTPLGFTAADRDREPGGHFAVGLRLARTLTTPAPP